MPTLSLRRLLQVHEQVDKTFYGSASNLAKRSLGILSRGDHKTTQRNWVDLRDATKNKILQHPETDPFNNIFGSSDLDTINAGLQAYGNFMYDNWDCIAKQVPQRPTKPISTQQIFQALSKPIVACFPPNPAVNIDIHTSDEVEQLIKSAKKNKGSRFLPKVPSSSGVRG